MNHGGKREGAGRKPVVEHGIVVPVLIPKDVVDLIPVPRSDWIRNLVTKTVREELNHDQI
jgi:hypothetical protein